MTNFDTTDRHAHPSQPASGAPKHAAPGGYQNTSHGPDYHVGENHLTQYGMRSDQPGEAVASLDSDHGAAGSVEAFDDEFRIREERDHRPRSIPTGVPDGEGGASNQAAHDASAPTSANARPSTPGK